MSSSTDFARAALAERRPSFFLSLAPATSASYPQRPARRPSLGTSVQTTRTRRASSSSATGFRVLKLGPVYWGEHGDDHQEDFRDVDPNSPPSPAIETFARGALEPASSFLSLAPATSDSYPQMPTSRPAVARESAVDETHSRRSSSSSTTTGFRVLKLGPVYWGEHADDHKGDFHDVTPGSP